MSISDRMKFLVEIKLPKYGRFQELERLTTIKNSTWQTWARGRQRPTEFMIQAIAWLWPEHALWLVTGEELPEEGLSNPTKAQTREVELLTEFTANVLKKRIEIRKNISPDSLLNNIDEPQSNLTEDMLREYADRLTGLGLSKTFTYSKNEGQELEGNFYDEIELQAQRVASHDNQLIELESTRKRLIQNALTTPKLTQT